MDATGVTTYGRGVRKLTPCMRRRAGGWARARRGRRGGRGPSAPCSSSCKAVLSDEGGSYMYINRKSYPLSEPSSIVRTSYWRAFSGSSPCLTFSAFLSRMTGANARWLSQRTSEILTLSERTDFLSGTIGRRSASRRSRCSVPRTATHSVYLETLHSKQRYSLPIASRPSALPTRRIRGQGRVQEAVRGSRWPPLSLAAPAAIHHPEPHHRSGKYTTTSLRRADKKVVANIRLTCRSRRSQRETGRQATVLYFEQRRSPGSTLQHGGT